MKKNWLGFGEDEYHIMGYFRDRKYSRFYLILNFRNCNFSGSVTAEINFRGFTETSLGSNSRGIFTENVDKLDKVVRLSDIVV